MNIPLYTRDFLLFSQCTECSKQRGVLSFKKYVFISIVGTIFTRDLVQFGFRHEYQFNMNWSRTHRAMIDCKDHKVSFKVEKRPYTCFMGKAQTKLNFFTSVMKATKLLRQASIKYQIIPTTFSIYASILAIVNLTMLNMRNYQDCPSK